MDPLASKMDPFMGLPQEISVQIFSNFSQRQLAIVSLVSPLWYKISQTNSLWKTLALNYFREIPLPIGEKTTWKEFFKNSITEIRNVVPGIRTSEPWKGKGKNFFWTRPV